MSRFNVHQTSASPTRLTAQVAQELLAQRSDMALNSAVRVYPLPSRPAVIALAEGLRALLFPEYVGADELRGELQLHGAVGAALADIERGLKDQLRRGMCFECQDKDCLRDCAGAALEIVDQFMQRLPWIAAVLATDARAAYDGDPACKSPHEPVLCYPGLLAVTYYRMAHELHVLGAPLIPRLLTEHAHSVTGIDIHPGAQIGESFFIDHGTGVVIGETSIIGRRVKLYQGVTLGAKSFPLDEQGRPVKGIARHPIVEDDVTIYSGATILGRVTIGARSVIGGNVWLTRDVPPDSSVYQQTARQERFTAGAGI